MRRVLSLAIFMLVAGARVASAQLPPDPPPTEIVIHPAAEPRPALKYRLIPERRAMVPGNAALYYHRAIQLLIENRVRSAAEPKRAADSAKAIESAEMQLNRWGTVSLSEFPIEEARKQLNPFLKILHEVELGAMRTTCDWEFDQRPAGIDLLLPEIQEMRSLARLVRARARLALAEGQVDQAMHWIQVGFVISRHVTHGPTVIQALVGIAIESLMTQCLIELIQIPGTPSLYWALADRPHPFIDLRPALEGERYLIEREIPTLQELDQRILSLDEARRLTGELQTKLFTLTSEITGLTGQSQRSSTELTAAFQRLGVTAIALKVYPEARQSLIAEGRPEAKVDAMPVVQVATLYSLQEFGRRRDAQGKWFNLPYWQSANRIDESLHHSKESKLANPLLALFELLTPALNQFRLAGLRADRQLDAVACIESIRMYAASHDGKLPASLDELVDGPAPVDPATGAPFDYKRDDHGDSATLTAPEPKGAPPHWTYKINYLLNLKKS